MSDPETYTVGELAEAGGVSRRTVRFYVQRGLLPPPEGLGRGAHYTEDHLAALLRIKAWQEQGAALDAIAARLAAAGRERDTPVVRQVQAAVSPAPAAAAPGRAWFRQPLLGGYELHVAAGRRPLSARALAALSRRLMDILDEEDGGIE